MTEQPEATTDASTDVYCIVGCDSMLVDLWQKTVSLFLRKYVFLLIVIVGVFGNSLTLAVMSPKNFRKSPSSLIIEALALADTGILLQGALRKWIDETLFPDIDLRAVSDFACKAHTFFARLFSHTSSAFLVILTVERAISVFFPLKCREICSRRRIFFSIITVTILLSLVDSHAWFLLNVQRDGSCLPAPQHVALLYMKVWNWVDSCLAVFAPFILIFIGNTLIVAKLITQRRRRRSMGATAADETTSSVTVMLIAVSACFLLLNLPRCIYYIGNSIGVWPMDTPEDYWNRGFFITAVTACNYINTSINFILYSLTGSKFRTALRGLLAGCACKWQKASGLPESDKAKDTACSQK